MTNQKAKWKQNCNLLPEHRQHNATGKRRDRSGVTAGKTCRIGLPAIRIPFSLISYLIK